LTGRRYNWVDPRAAEKAAAAQDQEIALLERALKAKKAQQHLLDFSEFTMPDPLAPNDVNRTKYDAQTFHKAIANDLTDFVHGKLLLDDGSVCQQLIFVMPPRHGKACAHDTPVLTTKGWREHGDLRVGDFVFSPDGAPTEILALSDEVEEVVPVTLSNGEVVRCHLNHEWTVYDRAQRPGRRWRTLETRDIAKRRLHVGPAGKRGGRYVLQVPDIAALRFPEANLPLHPYVLGAWLGDGSEGTCRIAHAQSDVAVVEAIEALGHPVSKRFVQKETGVAYTVFGGPRPNVGSAMQVALKALGVLRGKHIPEAYLRASVEQRLQLLAGLVDTDGHVEKDTGRVRFSTCSPQLRDGAYDLASTLGFRPYIQEVQPTTSSSGIVGRKVVFQVCFQPTMSLPTRLERKQILKIAKRRRVAIVSVGGIEKAKARSIEVDREDGLYLVGRQLVPTHNTQLSTKNLSAWVSGLFPAWDIGVASYSDTMAEDMGADVRAIMTSPQFRQAFPQHQLRKGGTSKSNIQTTAGGRRVFVGRGGALTGRGMNLGIGDDLFKDHEEARSQAVRDAAWNWFTKVFMTRRMGRKLVILTMTRWHSDDIIGRITDPENPHYNAIEAKKWKIIRLPAIAEEDDPLGRQVGEALWESAYGLDFLQSQQRLDPLGFAALYQQRPTVADGVLFRRENIQRYHLSDLPENLRYYAASDHAVGTKQRNDPSCFGVVGVDPQSNIYLTDLFWQRVPTDRAVEQMLLMNTLKNPLIWWAEKGHISQSIGPFLRKRMMEEQNYINLREVTPKDDKETRAQSIAGRVAMGKVYIPYGAIYDKAVEEMLAFPNGVHDDFVDMLSLIGLGLSSQIAASRPAKAKAQPKFGTLGWVKEQDRWAEEKRRAQAHGGF
jgi:predicted phage terminase large subunit-like protein